MNANALQLLAILLGGLLGGAIFLFIVAIRGVEPRPRRGPGPLERFVKDVMSVRGLVAIVAGLLALLMTRWLVAGIGVALLAFAWRGIGGSSSERRAAARLEALATWTESLRDTIAGAVGLEQAIPSSLRVRRPDAARPAVQAGGPAAHQDAHGRRAAAVR